MSGGGDGEGSCAAHAYVVRVEAERSERALPLSQDGACLRVGSLACAMVDAAPEGVLMCRCASSPPAVPDNKASERVSAPGSLSSLPERSNSIRFGQSTGRSWSSGPPCRYPKALCERSKALGCYSARPVP